MVKTQSKQILQFYQAYKAWLDAGAPGFTQEMPFHRSVGLCANLTYYFHRHGGAVALINARQEMENQFKAFDLDRYFPFHYQQSDRFYSEAATNTCHLNEYRIEWINMMVEVPAHDNS